MEEEEAVVVGWLVARNRKRARVARWNLRRPRRELVLTDPAALPALAVGWISNLASLLGRSPAR